MPIEATKYQVVDRQTGVLISTHKSAVAAHRKADKLDQQYGAIRYSVIPARYEVIS